MATKKAQVANEAATEMTPNRIKELYDNTVIPALVKKFNYKNVNQVPKLVKITINSGLGDVKDNSKSVQQAQEELKQIAGQKPILTLAKKSVANFKIREGQSVGMKVTLRGNRMYEFFDKFISIALPRVRDFRGVPKKSFDGRGNYAMGVKEQLIFPEISYDQVEKIRGFDICFTTLKLFFTLGIIYLKMFTFYVNCAIINKIHFCILRTTNCCPYRKELLFTSLTSSLRSGCVPPSSV